MPWTVRKVGSSYNTYKKLPNGKLKLKAHHTSRRKAQAQVRLLQGIKHGNIR